MMTSVRAVTDAMRKMSFARAERKTAMFSISLMVLPSVRIAAIEPDSAGRAVAQRRRLQRSRSNSSLDGWCAMLSPHFFAGHFALRSAFRNGFATATLEQISFVGKGKKSTTRCCEKAAMQGELPTKSITI